MLTIKDPSIMWENGEISIKLLQLIEKYNPVTCAVYAKENGLLDTEGSKRFLFIAKRQKNYTRMVNQDKLRSYNIAPK
jgi:hypothetical protein